MNNLLRIYSNHADAPDVPNEYSLERLLEKRIAFDKRGKIRFEHIYHITFNDSEAAEYDYLETIDHGGDEPK